MGGQIYFKLRSSSIYVVFVMYFYQQHFVIQLPLLKVIYLNKKKVIIFLSVTEALKVLFEQQLSLDRRESL